MKNKQPTKKYRRSPRVEQNHQRTRREILLAAQKILLERGADAVTLALVSAELGLTKQALYHYFKSKEALLKDLVTTLLDDEITTIIAVIENTAPSTPVLGVMIHTFYKYYITRLDAFRTIYCQTQLYSTPQMGIDKGVLEEEINPRTQGLFDILEDRLCTKDSTMAERKAKRQLAFSAWLSALGLMTMLGVADSTNDPLVHLDSELIDTLAKVFDDAAVK